MVKEKAHHGQPCDQLLPVRNSSLQGSLMLSAKRLQLFAYVLAELSSASTLLEDYTRVIHHIPERLTAAWQALALAAAWRITLDHTIRLYAAQKAKRWLRQHVQRRQHRRREAKKTAAGVTTPVSTPAAAQPQENVATCPADDTADSLQRRLCSAPSGQHLSSSPPAPTTENEEGSQWVLEDVDRDADGASVAAETQAPPHRRRSTPRRFQSVVSGRRALDGASLPGGRRPSGYLRGGAQLSRAWTAASSGNSSASSPLNATTSKESPSPTCSPASLPPPRPPPKLHKPFPWTSDRTHSKLTRLFAVCRSREDDLGQRIEHLREVLVTALFNQFLAIHVHHSANDLVLYRWLDRRRYLTAAQERALQVAVVAQAEFNAVQRILARQRRKARTRGRPVSGDGCDAAASTHHGTPPSSNPLEGPDAVEGVARAASAAAGPTTTTTRARSRTSGTTSPTLLSPLPTVAASWETRRRPRLSQPCTSHLDGGLTVESNANREELIISSPRARFSLSRATPHSPFSYHSAAISVPAEVYEEANASRDGRRHTSEAELGGMDWRSATPGSPTLSVTLSSLYQPPSRRRSHRRSESHEEQLGEASASSTRGSFTPRALNLASQASFHSADVPSPLSVSAPTSPASEKLPPSPSHATPGDGRSPVGQVLVSTAGTHPCGLPTGRTLGGVSDDTETSRTGERPGELSHSPTPHATDGDAPCEGDHPDLAKDDSLYAELCRDAPLPPSLSASATEKAILDVVPMPLQLFMRAATTFSPTICAFSLLSRCVVYASNVRNNEEESSGALDAAYARFLERERPAEASTATAATPAMASAATPHYFHLVIANREVGHCEHSVPCFGNRKFIFVPCADADALVHDDDAHEERCSAADLFASVEKNEERARGRRHTHHSPGTQWSDPQPHRVQRFASASTFETVNDNTNDRDDGGTSASLSARFSSTTSRHEAEEDDPGSASSPSPTFSPHPPRRINILGNSTVGSALLSSLSGTAQSPDPLAATAIRTEQILSPLCVAPTPTFSPLLSQAAKGRSAWSGSGDNGSPTDVGGGARPPPSTNRRGRRHSAALPDEASHTRDRLLFLGDQLPASTNVSPAPEPAQNEENSDEASEKGPSSEGGQTAPWPAPSHQVCEAHTRGVPTASLPTTASTPSQAGSGEQDGATRRTTPLLPPSSSLRHLSATRKSRHTPLAPPPFIQLAATTASTADALLRHSTSTTTSAAMKQSTDNRADLGTHAGASVSQRAVSAPASSSTAARAVCDEEDTVTVEEVKTARTEPTVAFPDSTEPLVGGARTSVGAERDGGGTPLTDSATQSHSGSDDDSTDEEDETLFYVMHARYCSAPAEANVRLRPTLMAATGAADADPMAGSQLPLDRAPPAAADTMKTAVDIAHALHSVKALGDAVGVASTLPLTLPAEAPPGGMPAPSPRAVAGQLRALAEEGARLQPFPFPTARASHTGDGYWQSTFDHTILQPPGSGQALLFPSCHPPPTADATVPSNAFTSGSRRMSGAHAHTAITPFCQGTTPTHTTAAGVSPRTDPCALPDVAHTDHPDVLSAAPSEGDLAFAAEVIARLQFWCVRGQPRESYVLNPHVTVEGRQAETTAQEKAAADTAPERRPPSPTPLAGGVCLDEEETATAAAAAAAEEEEDTASTGFQRVVSRPLKLLYSFLGTISFQEEVVTPVDTPRGNARRSEAHSSSSSLASRRVPSTTTGKAIDEEARADSSSTSVDVAQKPGSLSSPPGSDCGNGSDEEDDESSPRCDSFLMDEEASSGGSRSETGDDDDDGVDEVPDLTPPTAPTNIRGQALLFHALQESNEVVVCALRESRPHRGYHDLWHVGNTRISAGSMRGSVASLLKSADTLSDTEEDVTEFDRCEHLGIDGAVRWAQGAMAPVPPHSTFHASNNNNNDAEPLFPRKTIAACDRTQWQLERLRNEYRVARSSRIDALLVDSSRGKVIAAITLQSTKATANSPDDSPKQHPRHRRHGSQSHSANLSARGGEPTATSTRTRINVKHPAVPDHSHIFDSATATSGCANGPERRSVMERETRFRVLSFTPYISPLWRQLHQSKVLLVDMDRTLIDNAITVSPAEQRYWLINEQQRLRELHAGSQSEKPPPPSTTSATDPSTSTSHNTTANDQADLPRLQPMNLLTDFFHRTRHQQCTGHTLRYEERQPVTYFMRASTTASSTTVGESEGTLDYHKPITELICVRPGVRQWLQRTAVQWGIPIIMVTKSSKERAEAVVREVLDPRGILFQRYDAQIISADQITRFATDAPSAAAALVEAKKSALPIVRAAFADELPLGPHELADAASSAAVIRAASATATGSEATRRARQPVPLFRPHALARSVAIVDDSPQVWEASDWHCTVLIAPYTLVRVDPRYYLSHDDGYLSSLTLSCLFSSRCLMCPKHTSPRPATSTLRTDCFLPRRMAPRGCHCLCACPSSHRRRVVMAKRQRMTSPLHQSPATVPIDGGVAEEVNSSSSSSSSSSRGSGLFFRDSSNVEEVAPPPRRAHRPEGRSAPGSEMNAPLCAAHTAPYGDDAMLPAVLRSAVPRGTQTRANGNEKGVDGDETDDDGTEGREEPDVMSLPHDALNMSLVTNAPSTLNHDLLHTQRSDVHTRVDQAQPAVPHTPTSFSFAAPLAPFPDDMTLTDGVESGHEVTSHGETPFSGVPLRRSPPRHYAGWDPLAGSSINAGLADDEGDFFTPAPAQLHPSLHARGDGSPCYPATRTYDVTDVADRGDGTSGFETTVEPQRSSWCTADVEDVVPIFTSPPCEADKVPNAVGVACEGSGGDDGTTVTVEDPTPEPSYRRQRATAQDDVEDVIPI